MEQSPFGTLLGDNWVHAPKGPVLSSNTCVILFFSFLSVLSLCFQFLGRVA